MNTKDAVNEYREVAGQEPLAETPQVVGRASRPINIEWPRQAGKTAAVVNIMAGKLNQRDAIIADLRNQLRVLRAERRGDLVAGIIIGLGAGLLAFVFKGGAL